MPDGAVLRPVPFSDLTGWQQANFAGAWEPFRASAEAIFRQTRPLRTAQMPDAGFLSLARAVAGARSPKTPVETRAAFEHLLQPFAIDSAGFLTGYYEPVVDGSPVRTTEFAAPVLPRPDDLVTLGLGETAPGLPAGYAAARREPDGGLTTRWSGSGTGPKSS